MQRTIPITPITPVTEAAPSAEGLGCHAGADALQAAARAAGTDGRLIMASTGPAAETARAEVRALIEAKGHATENARAAIARLEQAFADGALVRTPFLDQALGDLMAALEQDEGQKLGGKSAEAARFILRAVDRALDAA